MNLFRRSIIGFLFLLPIFIFGQGSVSKSKLPGKWLLVKHLLTERGKSEDLLASNQIYTFDFSANGSYRVTYTEEKSGTTVYEGKWKLINGSTKLKLYDNEHVPRDSLHLVADRQLPVIRLTGNEFVTKELLFGMDLLGTSYYKRQK